MDVMHSLFSSEEYFHAMIMMMMLIMIVVMNVGLMKTGYLATWLVCLKCSSYLLNANLPTYLSNYFILNQFCI